MLYQLSYTPRRPPVRAAVTWAARPTVPVSRAAVRPQSRTPGADGRGAVLKKKRGRRKPLPFRVDESSCAQAMTEATTPAPTVRPPSRMAKRRPCSIAMGAISSTSIVMLSPGITISVPSGSLIEPVTSVVRK